MKSFSKQIDISLEKPKGSFKVIVNNKEVLKEENTITEYGMTVLSNPGVIVNPSGGVFQYLLLGPSRYPITRESTGLRYLSPISLASRSATIIFRSVNNRRYADVNLFYVFNTVPIDVKIGQIGLFPANSNTNMLFGKRLDQVLPLVTGDSLTIVYSIRIEIISAITLFHSGTELGVDYSLYGIFHAENTNTLESRFPYNSNGVTLNSGWATRMIMNNVAISDNAGRYMSNSVIEGDTVIRTLQQRVLAAAAGAITFFNMECGNYSNSSQGYSIRVVFVSNVTKTTEDVIIFNITLRIRWV